MTLKFARKMGCLRKRYQVKYHGNNTVKTSTYDGEYLITKDETKCKSFIEFIKKADLSVVSSNPEYQKKLKFNGMAYKDFHARVFFIQKGRYICLHILITLTHEFLMFIYFFSVTNYRRSSFQNSYEMN